MRILRLTPLFFRPGDWPPVYSPVGGVQHQTLRLTEGLAAAGVSQTVLTSHIPGSPRRYELPGDITVKAVGPQLPPSIAFKSLTRSWFIGVLPELRDAARRYDIVHLHLNETITCRLLAMIAGRMDVPLVITMHAPMWNGLSRALRMDRGGWDMTRWLESMALRSASGVAALTESAAEHARNRFGVAPERLRIIPDAIDPAYYRQPVEEARLAAFRARHQIPEGRPIIAYVGRISLGKGLRDLISVVENLADLNAFLLVCGDGLDQERAGLERRLSAKSGLADWTVTGFVPPEDVAVALSLADVLVLPSRQETFGGVLLEAMASGVPAVAYAVGGIVDVAGGTGAIALAALGDRAGFVAMVRRLLTDEGSRRLQVVRGRERVEEFTLDAAVAKHLSLYRHLVEARRPGVAARRPIPVAAE